MPFLAALPWIGSIVAGLAPSVISALAGAKTEDEARAAIAPQYEAAIAELVGKGVPRGEANAQVEEQMKPKLQEAMNAGAIPPWAEMLLGAAGGIGGWVGGAKLAAKLGGKVLASTGKETAKAGASAAAKSVASPMPVKDTGPKLLERIPEVLPPERGFTPDSPFPKLPYASNLY